jgi:DUF1680 family protein
MGAVESNGITGETPVREVYKIKDVQLPLPPHAIKFSGYLENYIQNSVEHWNKGVVPYSAFVDFFRTGRPMFALGEMWGKAVRSGCMFYRYTQDPELKNILEKTVQDMLSTQQPNGSISCVPVEKQPDGPNGDLWERKYVMLGMEEYYAWVNPDPTVLESLKKQADCIIAQIGNPPKTNILEQGWSPTGVESCSLLEPFMRLYKMTGEQRYLDFAAYIVQSGGAKGNNLFQQAYDNVPPGKMGLPYPKAYEMTSVFEGLVEYYRATGDVQWKRSVENYFRNINEREITVIGNGGGMSYNGELWNDMAFIQAGSEEGITRETGVNDILPTLTNYAPAHGNMQETCVGVTWMKYCSQLLRLTGDPAAIDAIEKYIYNGLVGSMKPDGTGFTYFNWLNGRKSTEIGWGWHFDNLYVTCCNLNGPMGLAYIPYIAITNAAEGPVVNLYNASTADLKTPKDNHLNLSVETDFPLSGQITVKVNPEKPEDFTLSLRIPAWSDNTILKVNGVKQALASGGHYALLSRRWQAGDKVELELDMRLRLINPPSENNKVINNKKAVCYGPVVLTRSEQNDGKFNYPVKIKADKNGYIKGKIMEDKEAGDRMEFLIPTNKGKIRMRNYASVNGWDNDAHICTWMPESDALFDRFNIHKPFVMICLNGNNTFEMKDGHYRQSTTTSEAEDLKPYTFITENCGNETVRIKSVRSGKYLTVNPDNPDNDASVIMETDKYDSKLQLWKIRYISGNIFSIVNVHNGKLLSESGENDNIHIYTDVHDNRQMWFLKNVLK